ncbi:MAG TPA: AmmeMemoRadiSam system protein B [Acetobacteraceae bacterium]|nr:AmmeMemoRadiSam system protein B [Acetobacteraceae bacterium]
MTDLRSPAVAGTFYPADPAVLRRQVADFLADADNAPPTASHFPKAIIAPHAGYVFSGPVAARAYARLAGARGKIRRVVLIGPSHYVGFQGLAVDTARAWAMPNGTVALDTEAIATIRHLPMVGELEAAYTREHALEVHVPFLQHVLGEFRLVPIVAGDTPPDAVAAVFDMLWGGPETLFVVSTDLSHYLGYQACQRMDSDTAAAIERSDIDAITSTCACGAVPTRGLLRSATNRGLTIERLDLRNSGDTAGLRDRVVGYGAWALYDPVASVEQDNERDTVEALGPDLIQLVRTGIAIGFRTGRPAEVNPAAPLPTLFAAHGAAFVTLQRNGQLRGCIGSPVATRPLIVDVVQHAFNAAFRDWRFPRLALDELAGLDLSVSVLTPPLPMTFADEADLLAQLQPGIDGLIIEDSGRSALFLPSVWGEIPMPRIFLTHLKLKSGMAANHFSPRFTARRFRSIEVKGRMADHPPLAVLLTASDLLAWSPMRAAAVEPTQPYHRPVVAGPQRSGPP